MKRIVSTDTLRQNRIPPGQHLVKSWPALHHGSVQRIDPTKWTFSIFGLVEAPRKLSFDEFTALPHVEVLSDIHCVTSWSKLDNLWEGISTSQIRDLAKIKPDAKYVMVHGAAGFTTNLSMDDFFQEDVLFVLMHDGEVLDAQHGFPVRLVVPRLYFWKSAKWVTGVEFMAENGPGFWESNGYHMRGDPWNEERYG